MPTISLTDILNLIGVLSNTASQIQADGRSATTAEETAALNSAMARLNADQPAFDAAFGKPPTS